jgi:hypothetical protein
VKLIAAPTREQGQEFVIVLVKDQVIHDSTQRDAVVLASQNEFGMRAALISEGRRETYGPQDIVNWLANIEFEQLPRREYSVN